MEFDVFKFTNIHILNIEKVGTASTKKDAMAIMVNYPRAYVAHNNLIVAQVGLTNSERIH